MPLKSKLPRLVVNRLQNQNLGRYTGVDVTAGKVIRKDEDGRDKFEDYFTPEEDSDSENEKTFALPTEVINRIKGKQRVDVSIKSMSPFSPSSSSAHSSISTKAISEKVSVLFHSSTEKDTNIQEVTIQKEAEIIVCNSIKDEENLQSKSSKRAQDENQNSAVNKSNCSLKNRLALTSLSPQMSFSSASKEKQQNASNKKQTVRATATEKKASLSVKSNVPQSLKQKHSCVSHLKEKNYEEVENLKPRLSTFVYQLPPEDLNDDIKPSPVPNLLYKGTGDGSISKASFSRRSTAVKWRKKTKARLSFSAAYLNTPTPEEAKPRCEEAQEEPRPEELNSNCSSVVDAEQEICDDGNNEERQSCPEDNGYEEDIGTPPRATTNSQHLSEDELSDIDLDELSKPFKFCFTKKRPENVKKKKDVQENENNHLNEETQEKQKDEFDLTITPKPVSNIPCTSDGYIIVNWKIKDKESRNSCAERPASTKQIVNISKLSCKDIENDGILSVSRAKKRGEEDYEKCNSKKKKSKKDKDLRKGSTNKKKNQLQVDKDSDLSSIIEESVCGDYQQLDLESLPELTLTSEDEKQKKKTKKKVISKRRKKKKEETRSQDSTADSALKNKLENNHEQLKNQKMEERKKEMDESVIEDIGQPSHFEDECYIGSPVIEIAPWTQQSSASFQKTKKNSLRTKNTASEQNTLADNETLSKRSCRGRNLKESDKKNQTANSSSLLKAATTNTHDLVSDEIIGTSQKKINNRQKKLKKSYLLGQQEPRAAAGSSVDNKIETLNESIPILTEIGENKCRSIIEIGKQQEKTKKVMSKKLKSVLEDSSIVSPDVSFGGNEEMTCIEEQSGFPKVPRKRNEDSDWRVADDSPLLRRPKKSNILMSSVDEQSKVDGETGEISSMINQRMKKSPQKKNKQSNGVGKKKRKSCRNFTRRSSSPSLSSLLKSTQKKRIKKIAKIVPPEETHDANLRRSRRQKVRPLQFWKNERIEYRRGSTGDVIARVISPNSPKDKRHSKARTKRSQKITGDPVNSSDLRKNFENNTPNQSIPQWIPETLSKGYVIPPNIQKFLEIVKKGKATVPIAPVPVINPETKEEVEISCISVKDSHTYVNVNGVSPSPNESLLVCRGLEQEAFSSGYIVLAPFAEKGMQFVKNDSMVFVVNSGEVLITIHETTGLVSEGDLFFVPCGNKYNIVNLQEKPAKLIYFRMRCGSD